MIECYKKQTKLPIRRSSSPKKSLQNSVDNDDEISSVKNEIEREEKIEQEEKDLNSTPIDYWYPPISEQKTKIAITDITSDNVTITFRELI